MYAEIRDVLMQITDRLLLWDAINGVVTRPIAMERGGVTCGTETPEMWKSLMSKAIGVIVDMWKAAGRGFKAPAAEGHEYREALIQLMVWADNILHISRGWDMFTDMVIELTNGITAVGLGWKASDCKVLSNQHVLERCNHHRATLEPDRICVEVTPGNYVTYKRVRCVQIVGVTMDETGHPWNSAMEHCDQRTFWHAPPAAHIQEGEPATQAVMVVVHGAQHFHPWGGRLVADNRNFASPSRIRGLVFGEHVEEARGVAAGGVCGASFDAQSTTSTARLPTSSANGCACHIEVCVLGRTCISLGTQTSLAHY